MLVLLSVFAVFVTSRATFDPTCVDRLPDCHMYDVTSCHGIYEPWAKANCNNTCGYCHGMPTPAPACRNKIPNCDDFDHNSTCGDPQYKYWVEDHCRLYCRKCTTEQLYAIDHPKGTPTPQRTPCRDLAPDCAASGKSLCTDPTQTLRAHVTCKNYCGYCSDLSDRTKLYPVRRWSLTNIGNDEDNPHEELTIDQGVTVVGKTDKGVSYTFGGRYGHCVSIKSAVFQLLSAMCIILLIHRY